VSYVDVSGNEALSVAVSRRRQSTASAPLRVVDQDSEFPAGFVAFYRQEYPGAVRLALLLTGSNISSDDMVQDAFVRVARRFATIEAPAAYLRTAVVNAASNCKCNDGRHREKLRGLRPVGTRNDEYGSVELADVILSLPFRQRVVVVGRYWAGWTEDEIAVVVGCRPGTSDNSATNWRRCRNEPRRRIRTPTQTVTPIPSGAGPPA
jgi:DNA-directed RNA polymerase specialized sigma24 family protein